MILRSRIKLFGRLCVLGCIKTRLRREECGWCKMRDYARENPQRGIVESLDHSHDYYIAQYLCQWPRCVPFRPTVFSVYLLPCAWWLLHFAAGNAAVHVAVHGLSNGVSKAWQRGHILAPSGGLYFPRSSKSQSCLLRNDQMLWCGNCSLARGENRVWLKKSKFKR